jgi:hypothetical protein
VKIAAMTSYDLRVFAEAELRRAANEFEVRKRTCDSARQIADEVDEYDVKTVREWWDRKSEACTDQGNA